MLEGIAGLRGRDRLLDLVFQFLGDFLGQDGHDRAGGHAVFEGVAPYAVLPLVGFRPGAPLRIAAVGFDLCCGGQGVSSPGGIDQGKDGGLSSVIRVCSRWSMLFLCMISPARLKVAAIFPELRFFQNNSSP